MNKSLNIRNHGLDTLRSVAIILVFLFHYSSFCSQPVFGTLGRVGWAGVDLFFVLSGYLIGNQIFSILLTQQYFSLKIFYFRRLLRTLPNYLFILGLYFIIPLFREQHLTTPIWKFLTFTQNFGLSYSAFSHAWSLCLEEQFYLIFPLISLFIEYKNNVRKSWWIVCFILFAGIILRSSLWFSYIQEADENKFQIYMTQIYYFPLCRLDGLVLGVSIAILKNFHQKTWIRIAERGYLFLTLGLLGCYFTMYPLENLLGFFPTTFGYLLRSASLTALTLSVLCANTFLYKTKIPGAMTLAAWSYAIYLSHKSLIHITHAVLSYWSISKLSIVALGVAILICLIGGCLLYTFIERPFLKLREKFCKNKATPFDLISNTSTLSKSTFNFIP